MKTTMKTFLGILLGLALVMVLISGMIIGATAEGHGTKDDPYLIDNWNLLASLMNNSPPLPSGETADHPTYYRLTQDATPTHGSDSSVIVVGSKRHIVLDLNGKTIDRKLGTAVDNGYVIKVDGNLTIIDSGSGGTITGGNNSLYGGGVIVNGKFTLKGGTISGNRTSKAGGGVYVSTDGAFTLSGGEISGNTASEEGGGVSVYGAFTMKDGTISGNTASSTGGVFVNGGGQLPRGTFNLSGAPEIKDNKAGSAYKNVVLKSSTIKIHIGKSTLNNKTPIGVSFQDELT